MLHDIILFAAGIVVGAMNAIAGGGMLVGFPILLAMGVPAIAANASTSIIILPGALASARNYRRYLKKVPTRYLLLLIPAMAGAIVGSIILRHTSAKNFEQIVPGLILFAVFLFVFQPFLYNYIHQHIHGPKQLRENIRPMWVVALAVFPLGIYASYFGAGFGFIMLAFLSFTKLHDHIHRMNALKNIMAIFISLTALFSLLGSHLIDWRHGLVMGAGSLFGGYYGSILIQKVSSHAVRIIIIVIGISTAAYLVLRTY